MSDLISEQLARESASHWVRWNGEVPTFTCNGDEHAPCHRFSDCDCEVDNVHPDHDKGAGLHQAITHDRECWVLGWLQYVDVDATYGDGEGTPASVPRHNARIEWEWDGDGMLWTYADPELDRDRVYAS